jgi:hypothetical protein
MERVSLIIQIYLIKNAKIKGVSFRRYGINIHSFLLILNYVINQETYILVSQLLLKLKSFESLL